MIIERKTIKNVKNNIIVSDKCIEIQFSATD